MIHADCHHRVLGNAAVLDSSQRAGRRHPYGNAKPVVPGRSSALARQQITEELIMAERGSDDS